LDLDDLSGKENKFTTFIGLDKKRYRINLRQKLFGEKYLEEKGNGVEAIIEAGYDVFFKDKDGNSTGIPNRKLAAVLASQNLSKLNICAYITLKLDEYGFNDNNAERQHLFLMNQYADLTNKKGALDMFYKLRGSYAPEKHQDVSDPFIHLLIEINDNRQPIIGIGKGDSIIEGEFAEPGMATGKPLLDKRQAVKPHKVQAELGPENITQEPLVSNGNS